jgi:hypothetical protein
VQSTCYYVIKGFLTPLKRLLLRLATFFARTAASHIAPFVFHKSGVIDCMKTNLEDIDWECEATHIMYDLKDNYEIFTIDDFYRLARKSEMPPQCMKIYSETMFEEFRLAGYIEKTSERKFSERDGSTSLTIWRKVG